MIESKHAQRTNQTMYEHFNAKRGRQGPSERSVSSAVGQSAVPPVA